MARADREAPHAIARGERAHRPRCEARALEVSARRWLEPETVALSDRCAHLDEQFTVHEARDHTEFYAPIVGLRSRDVLTSLAPAVHATGEAAREDLDQRLHFFEGRRHEGASCDLREELAVSLGDRGNELRLLLPPFDLQASDPRLGDLGEVIPRAKVLCRDQVSTVEFGPGHLVAQDVVLAARLGAGTAVGGALGDHPGHEALARIRDAERAVHERFQAELRHGRPDLADVPKRVLARQHHAIDAESFHHPRAGDIVHRHLGGAVDLEAGIDSLDESHQPDVLHDRRIDPAIDALPEVGECVSELTRLHQDVEGEIDPRTPSVGDQACLFELIERELRAVIPCVEL